MLYPHDISDFEEAGEALPGGVPEHRWLHQEEDTELYQRHPKYCRGRSRSSLSLPAASHHFPQEPRNADFRP